MVFTLYASNAIVHNDSRGQFCDRKPSNGMHRAVSSLAATAQQKKPLLATVALRVTPGCWLLVEQSLVDSRTAISNSTFTQKRLCKFHRNQMLLCSGEASLPTCSCPGHCLGKRQSALHYVGLNRKFWQCCQSAFLPTEVLVGKYDGCMAKMIFLVCSHRESWNKISFFSGLWACSCAHCSLHVIIVLLRNTQIHKYTDVGQICSGLDWPVPSTLFWYKTSEQPYNGFPLYHEFKQKIWDSPLKLASILVYCTYVSKLIARRVFSTYFEFLKLHRMVSSVENRCKLI